MALPNWSEAGDAAAASDPQNADLIRDPATKTSKAIDEVVAPKVTAAIAADGTIAAAGAAAATAGVASAVAARDLVSWSDQQAPRRAFRDSWRVRDTSGKAALEVDPNGAVHADGRSFLAGMRVDPAYAGFRLRDRTGKVTFDVTPTGEVLVEGVRVAAGGAGTTINRVVHLAAAAPSQSNVLSHAMPFGPEYDKPHPRIFQYNHATGLLELATVPMSSLGDPHGLSVMVVMARELVNADPNAAVVLNNTAVGDSGAKDDAPNGCWLPGYAGANRKLMNEATAAWVASKARIAAAWPTLPVETIFVTIHGERDSTQGVSPSDYITAWDSEITASRTGIGVVDAAVVVGGMVPEWTAQQTARVQIRATHVQAPARLTRVAYVDGILGGGGSQNTGDTVHYSRAGIVALGKKMAAAIPRAIANVTTSVPQTPINVRATRLGLVVTLEWDAPICRVTDYTVTWSTDNFATSTTLTRATPLETTATVTSSAAVQFRIQTVNENGSSALTRPIGA